MISEEVISEQINSCETPHGQSKTYQFSSAGLQNVDTPRGEIQEGLNALQRKYRKGYLIYNELKFDPNKLVKVVNNESNQLIGNESAIIQQHNSKNLTQSPILYNNNMFSQKTMLEQSHNNQVRSDKKKKSFSLYSTIKWKQFAKKWLNLTSFWRFKMLHFHHFNLINDKATILSEELLPNAAFQRKMKEKNMKQSIQKKQKYSFFCCYKRQKLIKQTSTRDQTLFDNEDNFMFDNAQDFKFKYVLTVQHFLWLDKWFNWIPVLSPSGTFKFIWDIIILFVITLFLFMIPLEITIGDSLQSMFNDYVVYLSVSILITDFLLAFNFGYFEKGLPITKRSQVILNYLKSGIVIDICASIFLIYDILFSQQEKSNPLHLLFFLKVNSIKKIFKKIEERFHLTPKIMQISSMIQLLFLILTVSHIFGCMWVAVAHLQINNNTKSWIQMTQYDPNDWLSQYICAYYFATVTMITVGYGDFSPVNNTERIVNIASMLISCGVFAYSINAIGEIFSSLNQQRKRIKGDLFTISNFMSRKNINQELQYEVREFLEYQWYMQNDRDQEKEKQLIDQLSPQLREKLLVETYNLILHQYKIFSDNFSDEFLISMIGIMEEYTYRPDEQITCELYEQENDLYFIESGRLIVYVDENAEKIIKVLGRGDHFGEIAFFSGQAHSLNVKATEYSSVIRIRRKKFLSLIQTYPVDYEIFCSMQDKILYSKEYNIINNQCFSCRSPHHIFKQCPYIHLIINNIAIINQVNRSEFNLRKEHQRSNEKFPSFILQNVVQENIYRYFVNNGEYIDSYIDQYFGQYDFDDQSHQNSQDELQEQTDQNSNNNIHIDRYVHNHENKNSIKDQQTPSINTPVHNQDYASHNDQYHNIVRQKSASIGRQQSISAGKELSYGHQFSDVRSRRLSKDGKSHLIQLYPTSAQNINSDFDVVESNQKVKKRQQEPRSKIQQMTQRQNSSSPQSSNSPSQRVMNKNREKSNSYLLHQSSNYNSHLQQNFGPTGFSDVAQRMIHSVQTQMNNMNNSMKKSNAFESQTQIQGSAIQIIGEDDYNDSRIRGTSNTQIQKISQNTTQKNMKMGQSNKIRISQIIDQIVRQYAERDYEGQNNNVSNQDDFDKQKNYDFYLPHNNLSLILEYFKFKQKNMKNMRQSFHAKSQAALYNFSSVPKIQFNLNQKESFNLHRDSPQNAPMSQFNSNLISNSRNHHLFRKFQQQKMKLIESKQRRQAMLIKKRKSQKIATTKMQKLILKFEQISNVTPNSQIESPSGAIFQKKPSNNDVSLIDNLVNKNRSFSNKYTPSNDNNSKRMSIFCNPLNKFNQLDELKDVSKVQSCLNQVDEVINQEEPNQQNTDFLNLQRYIQNKIRFSIRVSNENANKIQQLSESKSINDLQAMIGNIPQNQQENEDISSSSETSSGIQFPNNNDREAKMFKQNQSNNLYNFNDMSNSSIEQNSIFYFSPQN